MRQHAVVVDALTDEVIGTATPEQVAASDESHRLGRKGLISVDEAQTSWDVGDRTVQCTLATYDASNNLVPETGSLRR
jgi:hypothetical protein